ncbi:MAG: sigma-70 family RNA polymerase sigma factor [Chloroflexaceae bacterium]
MLSSDQLCAVIERAQQRDPTAISELYASYAGMILRYIHARVAEVELAQDLTQEVFIKIINGINRFEYRDEKAFLGWMYTIAANVLYSHQRRRRVVSTPFDTREDLVDTSSENDVRMITDRIALQQALGQLTRDQQQVLTLRFFADMSNSEIAGVLQRSEGAIKAIQHRALQSLQKILNREAEEPAFTGGPPTSRGEQGYQRQCALNERELGVTVTRRDVPIAPCEAPAGD